jgi:mannose-6-phosphate isomerase-like protein (cupin superfamily)
VSFEMEGGCRVFGLREGKASRKEGLRVWRHVGRETGAQAISFSTLELEAGSGARWLNAGCDEVFFVLEGKGDVFLDEERHEVGQSAGVFVRPWQEVRIRNSGRQPLVLLDSRCPDPGPGLSFDSRRAAAPSGGGPAVVRFEDQPVARAGDGRSFRVLVDSRIGCEQTTQFVGFVPPGRAPDHFHEYEEVVCILEGEGLFWSGRESAPIAAGTCVYLPRRQPHCVENRGDSPLSLYGLFYPAGSPAVRYAPDGISATR